MLQVGMIENCDMFNTGYHDIVMEFDDNVNDDNLDMLVENMF